MTDEPRDERLEDIALHEERERLERERLAGAPRCEREGCVHELPFHDPCSKCACPAYIPPANGAIA